MNGVIARILMGNFISSLLAWKWKLSRRVEQPLRRPTRFWLLQAFKLSQKYVWRFVKNMKTKHEYTVLYLILYYDLIESTLPYLI
jgi:hypothetical protein